MAIGRNRLASFKALDDAKGIFEAIVAVFNNVDRIGDKILPGAFKDTLANWETKGRPIPVIFSHQWENLDAHIGHVLEAKETDEGLYVKGQLDMDEDFAARVWKKMKAGTLAEFSFAYDEVDAGPAKVDGEHIHELRKLDLMEVGPCLVGMNPETQLLGVKNLTDQEIANLKALWDLLNTGQETDLVKVLSPEETANLKVLWGLLNGKEGRRNSATDARTIQAIHDAACEIGAKCASAEGSDEDEAGNGKSSGPGPSTFAARIAAELLEAGID
jgi:hypothetical protein